MKRRNSWITAIGCSIAILMTATISMAAEGDDNGPPDRPAGAPDAGPGGTGEQHQKAENKKFSGTVTQFNFTPRGERDGILLTSDGKLVQLNFSPRDASKLSDAIAIGDQISAEAAPERARADHTVCRLQKVTTASGKEISMSMGGPQRARRSGDGASGRRGGPDSGADNGPGAGPGEGRPADAGEGPPNGPLNGPPDRQRSGRGPDAGPGGGQGANQGADDNTGGPRHGPEGRQGQNDQGPADQGPDDQGPGGRRRQRGQGKVETLKGVVKYLNHGPRGEVDGAVLDNGDFIRTGPREATEAKLAVGGEVSAEGPAMKMPDGHMMIEFPRKINDKAVSRPPMSGRRGGFGDRQPSGPPGDAPPPAGDN